MGMALVPMVAPMLGGGLELLFGWHAVFVMLLLSGAGVLWLCWRDLGETAASTGTSFRDQARDYPILLTARRFWGYALAAAFASGSFFAFLGGAPYAASAIYGLSPFWTGVGFGAPAVGYALGNFLSGRYSARIGINAMMLWGGLVPVAMLGLAVALGLAGVAGPVMFFFFCTFIGVGNGMVIPSATAGLLSVRPQVAGTASGLGGAIMIGGGAAVSVLAGVVLEGSAKSLPLQVLMLATSTLCLLSVIYVIRRAQQVARG
jgi:DHA1 family bicyclomycin/chloramphenicol resistance-like MFS transporter